MWRQVALEGGPAQKQTLPESTGHKWAEETSPGVPRW